ncbi:MAG: fructose-bisphosphate aldolase class I [Fidelibacterota bacterium]|nr:MAG: fructose-bisphosphate aldolase class I [Candidatus Neomarinimicrobiota bacterium]
MNKTDLAAIANAMVAEGKGILAADESTSTIKKRLASIDVESTEESRRAYRDLLFTTEGAEEFISGVILYDETLRQKAGDGTPFPALLNSRGIIPGIKPDKGAKPMAGFPGEKVTEGLDGLRERLQEYYDLGARFGKWRAVITIGDNIPTRTCLAANAHALARYAALCQEVGLVPIVEPEVLMDGAHTLERCEEVTTATLNLVFAALVEHGIFLEGAILKPNMVISGKECPKQAGPKEIAEATVRCFRRSVPAAIPGIVFLSGGQSPEEATENLNAMNALGEQFPWELSFSYGRALQEPVLKVWKGKPANVPAAQKAYYHRAKLNGAARYGTYTREMEQAG